MSEGRHVAFHGTKVGFASILIAERYTWVREMDLPEVKARLAATPMPDVNEEIEAIRRIYGPIAGDVISTSKRFLEMTPAAYQAMQERVIAHWPEIQSIAAGVPTPEEVSDLLSKAGLPTAAEQMGLTPQDVQEALYYGHYLRNPFTVIKLLRILGVDVVKGIQP